MLEWMNVLPAMDYVEIRDGQTASGELMKLSRHVGRWQRRFFMLHKGSTRLLYKVSKDAPRVKGAISLVGMSASCLLPAADDMKWTRFSE